MWWVHLTSRHFSLADYIWGGRHLNAWVGVSPSYLSPISFVLFIAVIQWMTMCPLPGTPVSGIRWIWPYGGPLNICPPSDTISSDGDNQIGPIHYFTCAEAWKDPKTPKSDMAYLLLVPNQVVEEERKFGLVVVWTYPCQACLPSLDEVAEKTCLTD